MSERYHEYPMHPTDGRRRVYFLRPVGLQGPIKIGISAHPRVRLGTFLAWSPLRLELITEIPGDLALERAIHDCFADAHSHAEWFHPTPRLLAFIADLQAGKAPEASIDLSKPVGSVAAKRRADTIARRGTSQATYSL